MKEAVDMTPKEYRKFIFDSGVKRPIGWERKIITMNASGNGNGVDMKTAIDMTPEEYKKFIFKSGVGNYHQGGKILNMPLNAEGKSSGFVKKLPYILSGIGLLGGLYYAFKHNGGWSYLGYSFLGSVAGSIAGGIIVVAATPNIIDKK